MMNKNNVPYYIAGTLATFTLLASGVFAAAPYIGFLAPVAALSVGLPFVIGGAIFSAVVIALSAVAISKNNAISEKEAQLADEKSKVETKDTIISEKEAIVQAQEQTISGQNDQLTKKEAEVKAKEEENSEQKIEINKKNEEIDNQKKEIEELKHKKTFVPQEMKDIQTAFRKAFTSVNEAYSSRRVPGIVKRGLTDVYYPPIESAKGTISSVGNKLKNVYDTMPSTKIEFSWVSEKFSPYWNSVKNLMFGNKADQASGASQLSSESQGNGIVISEGANRILFDFLFRGEQKMVKQSLREPANEENGQGWGAWGKAKLVAGVGLCGFALYCTAQYIPTVLNGVVASSADSKLGYTNGTMCYSYNM